MIHIFSNISYLEVKILTKGCKSASKPGKEIKQFLSLLECWQFPELQIFFSHMRIYPLIFDSMLISKFQGVFLPPIFFRNAEKRRYYCFETDICSFMPF